MKLEIPFDENLYLEQTALHFKLAWSENLMNYKKRLYWAIPSLFFGIFLLFQSNVLGYLFLGIGLHYISNTFNYYSYYKKSSTSYFTMIKAAAEAQKAANQSTILEFKEAYFRYENYKYDAKINWEAFKGYRLIDRYLFLDLEYSNDDSYVIGELEVGKENFEEIIAFLRKKIE